MQDDEGGGCGLWFVGRLKRGAGRCCVPWYCSSTSNRVQKVRHSQGFYLSGCFDEDIVFGCRLGYSLLTSRHVAQEKLVKLKLR